MGPTRLGFLPPLKLATLVRPRLCPSLCFRGFPGTFLPRQPPGRQQSLGGTHSAVPTCFAVARGASRRRPSQWRSQGCMTVAPVRLPPSRPRSSDLSLAARRRLPLDKPPRDRRLRPQRHPRVPAISADVPGLGGIWLLSASSRQLRFIGAFWATRWLSAPGPLARAQQQHRLQTAFPPWPCRQQLPTTDTNTLSFKCRDHSGCP